MKRNPTVKIATRTSTGPASMTHLLPRIAAIGITQIIGWGATFNLPGVLGPSIATSLNMSLPVVLSGSTAMLVTLALIAWMLASRFERHGARPIMLAGTIVAAIGLVLLATAQHAITYFLAWIVLGVAGAGILTTSAQIALAEIAGGKAKQAIGLLALFGGLASTIFWPLANSLQERLDWRVTTVIFACFFITICFPLLWWAIPRKLPVSNATPNSAAHTQNTSLNGIDFGLMAGAIAANGFITWGFSLTLIVLFEQRGIERNDAVVLASLLGIVQIGARAIDYLGGTRWSGLTTGIAASVVLPMCFLLLLAGTGRPVVVTFVLLYGLAGGSMAVARSTIPLAIFPPESYARASSRLALPLNLAYAAAPPAFGAILTRGDAEYALKLAIVLSVLALISLLLLTLRQRDRALM